MDVVLIDFFDFDAEVPVFILCCFHGGKQIFTDSIEQFSSVFSREDQMISKKGFCVVETFVLAHTENIVKNL